MLKQSASDEKLFNAFIPKNEVAPNWSFETDIDKVHKRNSTFSGRQIDNLNSSSSTLETYSSHKSHYKQNRCTYFSFYGLNTPKKPDWGYVAIMEPFKFHTMPLPPIPDNFARIPNTRKKTPSNKIYRFTARATEGFTHQHNNLVTEIDSFLIESEALRIRKETFWIHLKAKFKQVPLFVDECRYVHTYMSFQNSLAIFLFSLGQEFLTFPFSPMRICRFDENFSEVRNGHEIAMSLVDCLDKSYSKLKGEMMGLKETYALYKTAKERAHLIECQFCRMFKRYGYNSKLSGEHTMPLLALFEEYRLLFLDTQSASALAEWLDFLYEVNLTFNNAEEIYKKTKQDQASAIKKYEFAFQMKNNLRKTSRYLETSDGI